MNAGPHTVPYANTLYTAMFTLTKHNKSKYEGIPRLLHPLLTPFHVFFPFRPHSHPIRAQTPTPVSAPCGRVRKYRQPGCRYSRPPAPSLSAIPHSAASSSRQIPPPPPVKHPGANTIHGDVYGAYRRTHTRTQPFHQHNPSVHRTRTHTYGLCHAGSSWVLCTRSGELRLAGWQNWKPKLRRWVAVTEETGARRNVVFLIAYISGG